MVSNAQLIAESINPALNVTRNNALGIGAKVTKGTKGFVPSVRISTIENDNIVVVIRLRTKDNHIHATLTIDNELVDTYDGYDSTLVQTWIDCAKEFAV